MKKLFLILLLITSFAKVYAQSVTDVPYLGFKGAANYSMNSFSSPSLSGYNSNPKWGFAGGIYFNIPIKNRFSIEPELLYSSMGSKLESTSDATLNATLQLNYTSIPVLIKFSPVDHLAIFVGPQVDLLVSAILNYNSKPNGTVTTSFQSVSPAATAGAEYWFTKNIGIYARYIYAIGNQNKKDPGIWFNDQTITSDVSSSAIQAGITIGFPFGEKESAKITTESTTDTTAHASHEADTDGDGIPDKNDRCPNLAGAADNYGCPDMTLYYSRDDATLDSSDEANLDRVVTFLTNNPDLNIVIEGYASTPGTEKHNKEISEVRAQNCVNYLVLQGVDPTRMHVVGYGEKNAVGDNKTEEGRAKSRRVVIKIAK